MSSPTSSESGAGGAENFSTINNYSTGNAIQWMVSTDERCINGRNEGRGPTTRQVAGYLSNESVIQISQDMTKIVFPNTDSEIHSSHNRSSSVVDEKKPAEDKSNFNNRFGGGRVLETATVSAGAASSSSPNK
jgi:hypothetical protein